jgi:hypothetical protein
MDITETLTKRRRAGAPRGNSNRLRWKTSEERQVACAVICKELEAGRPKEYLVTADWDTVERYIRNFPEDFPHEDIQTAVRTGINKLIAVGYAGMTGQVPGWSASAWIMMVMNRTNWRLRGDVTSASPETPQSYPVTTSS